MTTNPEDEERDYGAPEIAEGEDSPQPPVPGAASGPTGEAEQPDLFDQLAGSLKEASDAAAALAGQRASEGAAEEAAAKEAAAKAAADTAGNTRDNDIGVEVAIREQAEENAAIEANRPLFYKLASRHRWTLVTFTVLGLALAGLWGVVAWRGLPVQYVLGPSAFLMGIGAITAQFSKSETVSAITHTMAKMATIGVPLLFFWIGKEENMRFLHALTLAAAIAVVVVRSYRSHAIGRSASTSLAVSCMLIINLSIWVLWGFLGVLVGIAIWIGILIMWKLFNPPDLKAISDKIDWSVGLKLRWSVKRFGKLPTDYKKVLSCDRRHWMIILDESLAWIATRVIALIISILVAALAWQYIPIWAVALISFILFLYSMQKIIAWAFKVALVLEDEDGERRLMLVPNHPFSRQILNVKASDLKTPVVIQTTPGTLLGYTGYELGTLNQESDRTEQMLRKEFRRLPADCRTTILIGNF